MIRHGHVDHLSFKTDCADALSKRLVIGRDDAARPGEFVAPDAKLLIQDRDLSRMDAHRARTAERARARAMAGVLMMAFRSIGNIAEEKPAARRVLLAESKEMLSCYLSAAAMKR